jgi:hypothetical protein
MQKVLFAALFSAGMLLLGTSKASAQHVYVKVAPHATVITKPARPSAKHVWVGAEWQERDGKYVESPAHWDLPPAGHRAWVAGHWAHESRGQYWVPGHWA